MVVSSPAMSEKLATSLPGTSQTTEPTRISSSYPIDEEEEMPACLSVFLSKKPSWFDNIPFREKKYVLIPELYFHPKEVDVDRMGSWKFSALATRRILNKGLFSNKVPNATRKPECASKLKELAEDIYFGKNQHKILESVLLVTPRCVTQTKVLSEVPQYEHVVLRTPEFCVERKDFVILPIHNLSEHRLKTSARLGKCLTSLLEMLSDINHAELHMARFFQEMPKNAEILDTAGNFDLVANHYKNCGSSYVKYMFKDSAEMWEVKKMASCEDEGDKDEKESQGFFRGAWDLPPYRVFYQWNHQKNIPRFRKQICITCGREKGRETPRHLDYLTKTRRFKDAMQASQGNFYSRKADPTGRLCHAIRCREPSVINIHRLKALHGIMEQPRQRWSIPSRPMRRHLFPSHFKWQVHATEIEVFEPVEPEKVPYWDFEHSSKPPKGWRCNFKSRCPSCKGAGEPSLKCPINPDLPVADSLSESTTEETGEHLVLLKGLPFADVEEYGIQTAFFMKAKGKQIAWYNPWVEPLVEYPYRPVKSPSVIKFAPSPRLLPIEAPAARSATNLMISIEGMIPNF